MEDFITTEYNIVLKNLEKELKMKQMQTSSGMGVVDPTAAVGSNRSGGSPIAQIATQTAVDIVTAPPVVNQNLANVAPVSTGTSFAAPSITAAPSIPSGGGGGY